MKEVLDKAIKLIPTYISELLGLVQGPKEFIAERLNKEKLKLQNSIIFLAISFLVGWVLEASFLRADPLIELASDAAFVFSYVLAYGAALCLAWRIVKGRAPLPKFFFIHFYYSGVLKLIEAFWFMSVVGVLRASDPDFYKGLMDSIYKGTSLVFLAGRSATLPQSPAFLPLAALVLVGLCGALAWLFAGWGAYRELNHSSKARSALAATLFVLFWFPVTALVTLIANAAVK